MIGLLASLHKLDGPIHFQFIAAVGRSVLEQYLDFLLLVRDPGPLSVERFHAFTMIERFRVAEKAVAFDDANPRLSERISTLSVRSLRTPGSVRGSRSRSSGTGGEMLAATSTGLATGLSIRTPAFAREPLVQGSKRFTSATTTSRAGTFTPVAWVSAEYRRKTSISSRRRPMTWSGSVSSMSTGSWGREMRLRDAIDGYEEKLEFLSRVAACASSTCSSKNPVSHSASVSSSRRPAAVK